MDEPIRNSLNFLNTMIENKKYVYFLNFFYWDMECRMLDK